MRVTKLMLIAVILIAVMNGFNSSAVAEPNDNMKLQFNSDGKFKIVQFNDMQDDENIDPRTVKLMEKVLDDEKPDLVVLNGDSINGDMETSREVMKAINNIAQPMEERGVKWVVTFGNHDADHTSKTGVDEEDMLDIYMSYRYNLNKPKAKDITGTGNTNLLIQDSKGKNAAFNIWLFDSGRYAPEEMAGQDFEGYPNWDWLRFDQIKWYYETSQKLEHQTGHKVPSLAFMHIPLQEFEYMWYASPSERTEESHAKAVEKHDITGEKNECVCSGPFNSGMFAAMLERGDVEGVFSGHDHVNTYDGNYYGIKLGYAGSTGFGTYGLGGNEDHRLRGARVFNLQEDKRDVLVETHMVFAKDYGIQ
ncbi:phosphoesterase [Lentibacillus populi]|uniref:Phosphoesterase n=1 Tax=Lentibacillus populi TaxID=1827502 RepID=A0A9W5U0B7_9BACI|nr:metallophosphoesterase family protein [Lentibacillus populi]GGB52735.1 phosphoesterase [Lentibacillus populi]